MASNIVIDTSAILAVLLEAPADAGARPPLVTDLEHVMIRELAIDLRHAVDLAASWQRIV